MRNSHQLSVQGCICCARRTGTRTRLLSCPSTGLQPTNAWPRNPTLLRSTSAQAATHRPSAMPPKGETLPLYCTAGLHSAVAATRGCATQTRRPLCRTGGRHVLPLPAPDMQGSSLRLQPQAPPPARPAAWRALAQQAAALQPLGSLKEAHAQCAARSAVSCWLLAICLQSLLGRWSEDVKKNAATLKFRFCRHCVYASHLVDASGGYAQRKARLFGAIRCLHAAPAGQDCAVFPSYARRSSPPLLITCTNETVQAARQWPYGWQPPSRQPQALSRAALSP